MTEAVQAVNVTSVFAGSGVRSAGRTDAPLLAGCPAGRTLLPAVVAGKSKEGLEATGGSDGPP